ncbi:MAG: hypothetical protein KGQ40_03245, partial [Rhodospirillales bacterium]|nr:hypothetical protein [Rhodospirillales bacterium]
QWFASRLPYRLAPARAEAAGFTLIGGRLDAVHGRVVPVLVYRRGDGVAELYIWPEPGHAPQPPKALRRGRNALLYWRDKGMDYWAAGTLAPGELAAFVAQWRA